MERVLGPRRGERARHGEQGRHPDPAGHEQVAAGVGLEGEVVAGRGDVGERARRERVVCPGRAAPADRLPLDRDLVTAPVGRVAAQRVLPDPTIRQAQVDVGAGRPGGEFRARGMDEAEVQHLRRRRDRLGDAQLHDQAGRHRAQLRQSSSSIASPGRITPPLSIPQFRPERL